MPWNQPKKACAKCGDIFKYRNGNDNPPQCCKTCEPRKYPMSTERRALYAALQRCYNPRAKGHEYYASKGITVDPSWQGPGGFERFLGHIGPKPSGEYTLDRINNDRGYEPGNVRWATMATQRRNSSLKSKATGLPPGACLKDVARAAGVNPSTLRRRLKHGVEFEAALVPPKKGK
jgi:hypothetical protein